jgi:hypothetical protein
MGELTQILPGTGRWQSGGLTEGAHVGPSRRRWAPSTTPLRYVVPLPVPGRI